MEIGFRVRIEAGPKEVRTEDLIGIIKMEEEEIVDQIVGIILTYKGHLSLHLEVAAVEEEVHLMTGLIVSLLFHILSQSLSFSLETVMRVFTVRALLFIFFRTCFDYLFEVC